MIDVEHLTTAEIGAYSEIAVNRFLLSRGCVTLYREMDLRTFAPDSASREERLAELALIHLTEDEFEPSPDIDVCYGKQRFWIEVKAKPSWRAGETTIDGNHIRSYNNLYNWTGSKIYVVFMHFLSGRVYLAPLTFLNHANARATSEIKFTTYRGRREPFWIYHTAKMLDIGSFSDLSSGTVIRSRYNTLSEIFGDLHKLIKRKIKAQPYINS